MDVTPKGASEDKRTDDEVKRGCDRRKVEEKWGVKHKQDRRKLGGTGPGGETRETKRD
jgi:hypothetical protein